MCVWFLYLARQPRIDAISNSSIGSGGGNLVGKPESEGMCTERVQSGKTFADGRVLGLYVLQERSDLHRATKSGRC